MIKGYKEIEVESLDENKIEKLYIQLIEDKNQFYILRFENKYFCLTKEASLFPINNKIQFLKQANTDIYYKTQITNYDLNINENDLNLYKKYINLYKKELLTKKYGNKYLFGTVAVKTENGFITSIRGKTNLDGYTIVENIDHNGQIITVNKYKATLNAPLLDYLFNNKKIKIIVHLHNFDEKLKFEPYYFPGTVLDSIRDNKTSFNISNHGVVYLFDENENLI